MARSEAASVALYSLGSAEVLAAATAEVVQVLVDWGVLGTERDALEVGCGIGRLLGPLSLRLRSIVGIDLSPGMIDAARRRTRDDANVTVLTTDGRDLSAIADGAMDLVLGIDSLPYIVRAGAELVRSTFAEIHRVLRPHGDLVLCNYSYGHSRPDAAMEVARLAEEHALVVVRSDVAPFRLWNAIAYHLRRA
ncbi:MAG: class I SAM-dependent methyltransferase [Polyangiaceae bacterium]